MVLQIGAAVLLPAGNFQHQAQTVANRAHAVLLSNSIPRSASERVVMLSGLALRCGALEDGEKPLHCGRRRLVEYGAVCNEEEDRHLGADGPPPLPQCRSPNCRRLGGHQQVEPPRTSASDMDPICTGSSTTKPSNMLISHTRSFQYRIISMRARHAITTSSATQRDGSPTLWALANSAAP